MSVTRADVARLAGVSTAVVSYVVNNGPRPVATHTRQAVETAIEQLGYRPNVMARALKGGISGSVGLILPDQSNPYFAELAHAIEFAFRERETLVLIGTLSRSFERSRRYAELLIERRVDAIIAVGDTPLEDYLCNLDNVPVALVDRASEGNEGTFSVQTSGFDGAFRAVEHLSSHGHRYIGCVAGPPGIGVTRSRVDGWRASTGEESASLIAHGDFSAVGGSRAAMSLLSAGERRAASRLPRPTALFVSSDIQAMGVLHACDQLGLRVPDDIAITSFDGTRAGAFTHPALTSFRQPVEAMAEALVSFLDHGGTEGVRLDGNLVIRNSCGC